MNSADRKKLIGIIYIEDDFEMINLVNLILQRRGYEVQGALGGRQGLEMVRELIPDLVLLDIMMPDMDGWEVYQQMRANEATAKIPVIIISARSQPIDQAVGLYVANVADYINKPFRPQQLIDSIEKVLGKPESNG